MGSEPPSSRPGDGPGLGGVWRACHCRLGRAPARSLPFARRKTSQEGVGVACAVGVVMGCVRVLFSPLYNRSNKDG